MIIFSILMAMLVTGWINLQRASATVVKTNNARATARDALSRITNELRDAQPTSIPTTALPTTSPTPVPAGPVFKVAQPMEAQFWSVYNVAGVGNNVSGSGSQALTRIWLDTSGSTPQKTLYWQRGSRQMTLATNVVNNSLADTTVTPSTAYTALFRYAYRDSGGVVQWTDNSGGTLDLSSIIAVRVRLIIDENLNHSPRAIDMSTTVLPRNAWNQ
jgi:hypothetical protein